MLSFLDKMDYTMLIMISVLMLLAPFTPQPHLVEKFNMLREGTLKKPIDIFDVFYHLIPTALLITKLVRDYLVARG